MGVLSSKLRSVKGNLGKAFAHWCPGCDEAHIVWYQRNSPNGPQWAWDGNAEEPTTSPSIRLFDADGTICHYFLTGGKIVFCGDCQHELSGKTVDLPDWPLAPGAYGGIED